MLLLSSWLAACAFLPVILYFIVGRVVFLSHVITGRMIIVLCNGPRLTQLYLTLPG